jgi:hypothetical protein
MINSLLEKQLEIQEEKDDFFTFADIYGENAQTNPSAYRFFNWI